MSNRVSFAIPVAALALLAAGCATTTVPFRQAPAQPAAIGEVKIRPEPEGKARVELNVEHLASPSRLTPPRSVYLVWAQQLDGTSTLLGQLALNKKLEARWRGTVPFDSFRLVVTAEDFATPREPASPEVLVTEFVQVEPKRWYQF